jgi:hypothetical protein
VTCFRYFRPAAPASDERLNEDVFPLDS